MIRQASAKVQQLIEPVVEGLGYECVGIEFISQGKNSVLRIYIDTADGVVVEDCEKVSRQVSSVLDVEDPISGHYRLEVSSPGLDRPLFKEAHFTRFQGSVVKLKLAVPVLGRRNFTGTLVEKQGDLVIVEVDGEEFEIPFDDIDQARLVPQF